MVTERGQRFRIMVQCGVQRSRRDGLHIATGVGCMSRIGAGHGFLTMIGDGRRITMAAGCMSMAVGDGGLVRRMGIRSIVRSGRRLMSRSVDLVAGSEWASASDGDRSVGCHWDLVTSSIRGGDVGVVGMATDISVDLTEAASLPCERDHDSRM